MGPWYVICIGTSYVLASPGKNLELILLDVYVGCLKKPKGKSDTHVPLVWYVSQGLAIRRKKQLIFLFARKTQKYESGRQKTKSRFFLSDRQSCSKNTIQIGLTSNFPVLKHDLDRSNATQIGLTSNFLSRQVYFLAVFNQIIRGTSHVGCLESHKGRVTPMG